MISAACSAADNRFGKASAWLVMGGSSLGCCLELATSVTFTPKTHHPEISRACGLLRAIAKTVKTFPVAGGNSPGIRNSPSDRQLRAQPGVQKIYIEIL